jgi:hypothetical protein
METDYTNVVHPLKLRYWNDPWENGTKDASTKCVGYSCGPPQQHCLYVDQWTHKNVSDIDFSTDLYKYFSTARFPVDAFRYLDSYNVRFFTLMDMPR